MFSSGILYVCLVIIIQVDTSQSTTLGTTYWRTTTKIPYWRTTTRIPYWRTTTRIPYWRLSPRTYSTQTSTRYMTSTTDVTRRTRWYGKPAGIRLVNGYNNWEGRVELLVNGSWGTICDDGFDNRDAQVICHMLGYPRNGTAYGGAKFGRGSGSILLDDLECNGYEADISYCRSGGWYYHNCGHGEDAGVQCYGTSKTAQLTTTTPYWTTKYRTTQTQTTTPYWRLASTTQTPTTTATPYWRLSTQTTPKTPYWTSSYWTTQTATTTPYWTTTRTSTSVRLVGGSYPWEGRVELYHNGQWGTVCDDNFDIQEAKVICVMLGYSRYGNIHAYSSASFGEGNGPILLDDLSCSGFESDISECSSNGWFKHNCAHSEDAGISCRYSSRTTLLSTTTQQSTTRTIGWFTVTRRLDFQGHIPVRLNGSYGFLEVFYNGKWGEVCYNNYSMGSLDGVCGKLGYGRNSYVTYRHSYDYSILQHLRCPSYSYYDNGIDDCIGEFYLNTYCGDKVYLYCATNASTTILLTSRAPKTAYWRAPTTTRTTNWKKFSTRLWSQTPTSTSTSGWFSVTRRLDFQGHIPVRLNGSSGFLEVFYNGKWGEVCYNHYNMGSLDSVCGKLGYSRHSYVTYRHSYDYSILEQLRCPSYSYYNNGIDDCIGRFYPNNYCGDKVYLYCDSFSTENTEESTYRTTTDWITVQTNKTDVNHVTVNCQESNWYIKIRLPPLEQKYPDFRDSDIYLGTHSCTGYRSGDYLIFSEEYTTCKTNKTTTRNAVVYTNTLVYAVHDPVHHFIVREYRFKVGVECDMSKVESGNNNINNNHGQIEQQTLAGTGHFRVQLKFYSDSNYQHEFTGFPPSYMIGSNVYVKAETPIHDYDVKMRLSDCYTKPTESSSDVYLYYLIRNGCPADPNAKITSQSTHETRFYFQDFEYANYPNGMYVNCNATFCRSNDYSPACDPTCSHRKRKGHHRVDDIYIGPIGIAETEMEIKFIRDDRMDPMPISAQDQTITIRSSGPTPGLVVGIVVVAVAMVTVFLAVLVYRRKKRNPTKKSTVI